MTPFAAWSLKVKIILLVVVPSTIALTVFAFAMSFISAHDDSTRLESQMLTFADMIGQNSTASLDFDDRQSAASVLRALKSDLSILTGCLYDKRGSLFAEFRRDKNSPPCAALQNGKVQRAAFSSLYSRPIVRDGESIGVIALLADRTPLRRRMLHNLYLVLLTALLSLAIGTLASMRMRQAISHPFYELVRAMDTVTTQGTFEADVEVRSQDEVSRLAVSFNAMLAELRHRGDLANAAEARLREQARTDALTGLPNRRQFYRCLHREQARMAREATLLGLLFIDLDGFKHVNDTFGHALGDVLLCAVAKRIQARLRQTDTLARLGGDEFTVILPNISAEKDASRIASSLIAALSAPFDLNGKPCRVGASIGVLTHRGNIVSEDDLLNMADAAMYAAKHQGKNRAVVYTLQANAPGEQR